jgi:hypothetical protein
VASSCLPAGLGIDFICSSFALESLKLINFDFFSIAWMINHIWVVSFSVCNNNFVLSLLVSVLLAAFKNSKIINFDKKFEDNQFQFFQHCRDNEICSGRLTMSGSWFVFSLMVSCV